MNDRILAPTRRHASNVGIKVLVLALIAVGGQTIARAQAGRAVNQRPPQAPGTPSSLSPYGMPRFGGWYSPYPVKDPTADERAVVAGRVYRALVDESARTAATTPPAGGAAPRVEVRFSLELIERLGQWSLRWHEAQDNAAKTRAARYQAMSDHLRRMSALEDGRIFRETGETEGPARPKPPRELAEAARFFRPIDQWDIDRIIPTLLQSERPLNTQGVAVTAGEQVEIADRVYHLMLDEAVNQFLAPPRVRETRPDKAAVLDAQVAERLGFWSDLWRQSQDAAARDPSPRLRVVGDRSARLPSVAARKAGPVDPAATLRSHIERMSELETGRFVDVALKRTGRSAAQPADMTQFREFAEFARFFRVEAESQRPGASRPKGTDVTESGQVATASRIYRANLDGAAHRYLDAPREGEPPADIRLVFDPRLAERLAAWSSRWTRAQIRANPSRESQFNAIRSHIERMTSLEDGRSFRDALDRTGHRAAGATAPELSREFADVARFFRLEALWDLAQVRSR
jgi:hypothetical protein